MARRITERAPSGAKQPALSAAPPPPVGHSTRRVELPIRRRSGSATIPSRFARITPVPTHEDRPNAIRHILWSLPTLHSRSGHRNRRHHRPRARHPCLQRHQLLHRRSPAPKTRPTSRWRSPLWCARRWGSCARSRSSTVWTCARVGGPVAPRDGVVGGVAIPLRDDGIFDSGPRPVG